MLSLDKEWRGGELIMCRNRLSSQTDVFLTLLPHRLKCNHELLNLANSVHEEMGWTIIN